MYMYTILKASWVSCQSDYPTKLQYQASCTMHIYHVHVHPFPIYIVHTKHLTSLKQDMQYQFVATWHDIISLQFNPTLPTGIGMQNGIHIFTRGQDSKEQSYTVILCVQHTCMIMTWRPMSIYQWLQERCLTHPGTSRQTNHNKCLSPLTARGSRLTSTREWGLSLAVELNSHVLRIA